MRGEDGMKDPDGAFPSYSFETVALQTPIAEEKRKSHPWQAYSTVLGGIIYMTVSLPF